MDKLDLDINNYKLDDLLKLFHLTYDFNEEDIKFEKKIVLKTHPDKTRLDPKIYQFYKKAYDIVYDMYLFKNKLEKKPENQIENYEIVLDDTKEQKKLLDNFFGKNKKLLEDKGNSNKWFNEEFDKQKTDENEKGYSDWLKSDEGFISISKGSKRDMDEQLENKKKKLQELIVYKGVEELPVSFTFGGTSLGDPNETDNFSSSNIFSKFKYQDLKQAYNETIIPVTQDDFDKMPKYNSVNEYKKARDTPIVIPSKYESEKILENKNKILEENATKNAYYYSKQLEEYRKKNAQFMSNLARLEY